MNSSKVKRQSKEFVNIHFLDKQGLDNGASYLDQKDCFEIIFFKNTDGLEHFVDFIPNSAQKGDIFIVQPGQVHYFKALMGDQYEMVILSFTESFKDELSEDEVIADFFNDLEHQSIVFNFDECRSKDLDFCLWQLEYEIVVRAQFWKNMIVHYIRLLIMYLNRDGVEKGVMPKLNNLLQLNYQFKKLVEKNFTKHLDVAEYADKLNISSARLKEITHQAMQIQPEAYLEWRLNLEAKRLLFYNQNSLKGISKILGFPSLTAFTSFFLSQNNMAPLAFQNEMEEVAR